MEGKTVYVNKNTWDLIIEKLGYKPSILKVNPYIQDNQAIVIVDKNIEEFMKPLILPLSYFKT